ncbi:AbrB family transcriptional regulator [Rubellimicrobium rubrum]|uniref:AbrB family transcriptional regulator n=1 Tax=Rubellimicrobium rubrum TaxID=2585369 RepID=A0A5C4MKX1_9RHOB|nr:AbrB family transcriptional regulator [Rubellimicrobium rubrum]TNC44598.1 AbrB family transcriptional regulator [Rubellimicrobium rubrum]
MVKPSWLRRLLTLAVALGGLAVALWTGLPLPFLFGPMLASLVAALLGAPLLGMGSATNAARTVLGVAIGASVTPALLVQLPSMALSLALVPLYVGLIGLVGVPFFRRVCGFDRVTSFFAAMPGGATDMTLFGKDAGGDVRTLSLIHATRVAVIVTLAPILLTTIYGTPLDRPLGEAAASLPLFDMALMAAAALVGWRGGERLGLFGASMLGPLIITLTLSLLGLVQVRPPREALQAAQFLIGLGIGVHYVGVTWRELRRTVGFSVLFMLILAVLAAGIAETVVLLGLAAPLEAFLAFAPGGQAEMTILAIVAGAELGFVVPHHIARIVLVILGAPLMLRALRR